MKTDMRNEFFQKANAVLKSDAVAIPTCVLTAIALMNIVLSGALDRFVNDESYQRACKEFSDKVIELFAHKGKKGVVDFIIEHDDASFIYPNYMQKKMDDSTAVPALFHPRIPSGYEVDARSILDSKFKDQHDKGYKPVPNGDSKYVCYGDFPLSTTPNP